MHERFIVRSHRRAALGPLCVDIRSNEESFVGVRYLPEIQGDASERPADYTLNFCNPAVDAPWPMQALLREQDTHYRGRRFAAGYYITDHFGPPATLITRGTHYWILGGNAESILWPYFAKLLLTVYSLRQGMLHLKAAGISVKGAGTLLIGRGGSGKTVLLTCLCQMGAQFLSNTHTLVSGNTMIAVPAAMRVRNDPLFAPIIASRRLPAGIKRGEYVADPLVDLGWQGCASASLRNICLVDYRGVGRCDIREMDREVLFDYMEQFSYALNVYGLKEDILDHLGGSVADFSTHVREAREQLRAMIDRCSCYHVSCDATDPEILEEVYDLLGSQS